MVFIPLTIGLLGIIIYSFISFNTDPHCPYFDSIFHNDIDRFVQYAITQHPQHFITNSTTQPTSIHSPSYYINNPSKFPPILAFELCTTLLDTHGNNLFHWAAKALSLSSAFFLFEIGCDHNQPNFRGSTPFLWASTNTSLNPEEYVEYNQIDSVLENYQHSHESWYNTTIAEDNHPTDLNESDGERRTRLKEQEPLIAFARSYSQIPYNPMILLLYSFSQYKDQIISQKSGNTHKYWTNYQDTYTYRLLNHQNNDGDTALHFAAQFLSISSIKTILSLSTNNPAFINHHQQQPQHLHMYPTLVPTFSPFRAQLEGLQSTYHHKSASSLVSFTPTVVQTQLHQLVTKNDENSPLHVLPSDELCYNDHHCKKAVTYFIAAGFNPKQQNKYKRNLEHHLKLERITPLLSPIDELIIAQFLGSEPPKHIVRQLEQQQRYDGKKLSDHRQSHYPTSTSESLKIKAELDLRKQQRATQKQQHFEHKQKESTPNIG